MAAAEGPINPAVTQCVEAFKAAVREFLQPPSFFEALGVRYVGPFDGHNIEEMEHAFHNAIGPAVASLIMGAWHPVGLFVVTDLRRIFRVQQWEFWLSMACFAGVVTFGVIPGIGIAVVMGATKQDFDRTIGIHPTAAEEFVTMRTPVES